MSDPHDLQRFVDAQAPAYQSALAELRAGQKRGHWMWFVFPQLRGLGHSETARRYGIASRTEATAYLRHPLLGARLNECTDATLSTHGKSAHEIFGSPDELKFRSCLTLFAEVADEPSLFERALAKFFAGAADDQTISLLASG